MQNGLSVTEEIEKLKKRNKKGTIMKALKSLEALHNGMLTPYDVVEAAKNPKSPLHNSFEWDNQRAGEKYRLMQARIMLTTVKVEFMGERREAFFNATVKVDKSYIRGYFPIERVATEEEIRKEVIRGAIQELEYAQKKYASISQLRGVINRKKLIQIKKEVEG